MVCCFIGDGDISKSENSLVLLSELFKKEDIDKVYIGADGVFAERTVRIIKSKFNFLQIIPVCIREENGKNDSPNLAMIKRDELMVENSDLVVCCGSAYAKDYAKLKNKRIIELK